MLALVDMLARRIVRRGVRRGLLEGSTLWLAFGAIAWLVRLVTRPEATKITREDLRVGESLVVTHLPAPEGGSGARRRRGGDEPAVSDAGA